jgi:hypothetical protein
MQVLNWGLPESVFGEAGKHLPSPPTSRHTEDRGLYHDLPCLRGHINKPRTERRLCAGRAKRHVTHILPTALYVVQETMMFDIRHGMYMEVRIWLSTAERHMIWLCLLEFQSPTQSSGNLGMRDCFPLIHIRVI